MKFKFDQRNHSYFQRQVTIGTIDASSGSTMKQQMGQGMGMAMEVPNNPRMTSFASTTIEESAISQLRKLNGQNNACPLPQVPRAQTTFSQNYSAQSAQSQQSHNGVITSTEHSSSHSIDSVTTACTDRTEEEKASELNNVDCMTMTPMGPRIN